MKINKAVIKKMKPCQDRFDNFLVCCPGFDGNLQEFLSLDEITYNDKVWAVTRLLTKTQSIHWAIMMADSVKHIFNEKYLGDKSVDNLINYLKSGLDFEKLSVEESAEIDRLRAAANSYAASYASSYAAAYAAHAAACASSYTANYTACASYASSYAACAAYDANAEKDQQDLNLLFLNEVTQKEKSNEII